MSFILVGTNFYYCDSIEDVNYTWPEASSVFIKGTESYNGVYYTLTGGALIIKANQDEVKPLMDKQDTLISAENIKTINGVSVLGSGDLVVSSGVADGDKGDITVSSSGTVWTIDNLAVINAKINDVAATKVTEDSTHRFATDAEKTAWNAKQDALVSATNIKTINGSTILGSGDLTVSGSGLAQYQVRQLIRR